MKWRGGAYVYRTRKPHAVLGLPVIGRHFGYVGESNDFDRREGEHLRGSTRYATPVAAKPWADLAPKCYRIPLPDSRWLRRALEWLLIKLLMPVYNVKMNMTNPRRIRPWTAQEQRRRRDEKGIGYKVGVSLVRWVTLAAVAGLAFWAVTR